MKSIQKFLVATSVLAVLAVPSARAESKSTVVTSAVAQHLVYQAIHGDLLEWMVGDTANYDISAIIGKMGTSKESVTQDTGTGLWVKTEMSMQGQKDVMEVLFNKKDAKILQMKHNGQDMAIPTDKPEIISQDYTDVTVPAGKFSVLHVVAKVQGKKAELWINPVDGVIEGNIKETVSTGFMDITLALTSMTKMPRP